jgi:hypothetical protein
MKNLAIVQKIGHDEVTATGGKIWNKEGKDVAYFNSIECWLGLHFDGKNYFLSDRKIDSFNARQIEHTLKNSKLWFDFDDNTFKSNIKSTNLLSEEKILITAVTAILSAISEVCGLDFSSERLVVAEVNLTQSALPPLPRIPF